MGRNRNASVRQRRFGESGVCPDGPAEPASAFGEAVPEERGAVWTGHTGRRNKLVKGPGGPGVGGQDVLSAPGSTMSRPFRGRCSLCLRYATREIGRTALMPNPVAEFGCGWLEGWTTGGKIRPNLRTSTRPCLCGGMELVAGYDRWGERVSPPSTQRPCSGGFFTASPCPLICAVPRLTARCTHAENKPPTSGTESVTIGGEESAW